MQSYSKPYVRQTHPINLIPDTSETITLALVRELIGLTEHHLTSSMWPQSFSKGEVQDNEFSDIAFREPTTWQLNGFVFETKEGILYHRVRTGYEAGTDDQMFRKSPWVYVPDWHVYRTIFIVQAMRFCLRNNFPWLSESTYHPSYQEHFEKTGYLTEWQLQRMASFTTHLQWSPKLSIGRHSDGWLKDFQSFLRALENYLQPEPITYTFNLKTILFVI